MGHGHCHALPYDQWSWPWLWAVGAELTPGNLHINIVAKAYTDEVESAIEPYVYEVVCE